MNIFKRTGSAGRDLQYLRRNARDSSEERRTFSKSPEKKKLHRKPPNHPESPCAGEKSCAAADSRPGSLSVASEGQEDSEARSQRAHAQDVAPYGRLTLSILGTTRTRPCSQSRDLQSLRCLGRPRGQRSPEPESPSPCAGCCALWPFNAHYPEHGREKAMRDGRVGRCVSMRHDTRQAMPCQ